MIFTFECEHGTATAAMSNSKQRAQEYFTHSVPLGVVQRRVVEPLGPVGFRATTARDQRPNNRKRTSSKQPTDKSSG